MDINDEILYGNDPDGGVTIQEYDSLSDDDKSNLSALFPDVDDVSINSNGDVVKPDGTVIMSKSDFAEKSNKGNIDDDDDDPDGGGDDDGNSDDVEDDITDQAKKLISENEGQTITIDGVEYTIKGGVAVDSENNIKFDAEALLKSVEDSLSDDSDDDIDYISEITKMTGLIAVDDSGNPIEYEPTIEGIAKYVSDVTRQEGNRLFKDSQDSFFNTYAPLKDAFNYLRVNNTLNGFGNVTDHSNVKLNADDSDQLTSIIIEGEMKRGRTKEQAERIVKYAKDDNRLLDEAKDSLAFLKQAEEKDKQDRAKIVEEQDKRMNEQITAYWNDIKSTIDKGELEGYIIPENIQVRDDKGKVISKTRADFYSYVSESVNKNGDSAASLARANKGKELDLLIDYILFTGGDIKQLSNLQSKKDNANKARLKLSKNKSQKNNVVIGKAKDKSKANNNEIKF